MLAIRVVDASESLQHEVLDVKAELDEELQRLVALESKARWNTLEPGQMKYDCGDRMEIGEVTDSKYYHVYSN